jgi:hypothetical protein
VVKISAQSEHFSVLVLQVSHRKFWLFKPIFRHLDPDSGSRPRLNADPTGSETLQLDFFFSKRNDEIGDYHQIG